MFVGQCGYSQEVDEALANALDAGFRFGGGIGAPSRHPGVRTRSNFVYQLQRFLEDLPAGLTVREIRDHFPEMPS